MKTIGTWIRECDEAAFERTFSVYPDVRVLNARTGKVPSEIDALMLTGGSDISEPFLRQAVPDLALIEDADPVRDKWEFAALERALQTQLPIFAICRGLQVLNVALGGTLHLDIPAHDNDKFNNVQELRYTPEAPVRIPRVNSSHHQSLDRLGRGLHVEAWHAGDNTIEQARLDEYPFALGVQYHPERDAIYRPLFDHFVENIKERAWT